MQRTKNAENQEYREPRMQRTKNVENQEFREPRMQRTKNAENQECREPIMQRTKNVRKMFSLQSFLKSHSFCGYPIQCTLFIVKLILFNIVNSPV